MSVIYEVAQGDSGPLIYAGVDGVETLDSNYDCFIAVQNTDISREVTQKKEDNSAFVVQLTPTETSDLENGTYILGVRVQNLTLTPPFRRERRILFRIIDDIVEVE